MVTLERYDEALDTLKELISVWPNALDSTDSETIRVFADAHWHMATCCYARKRSSEAVRYLREALLGYEALKTKSNEIALVCSQLALRLQEQSRFSEALDYIQRVIECANELDDNRLLSDSYRQKALILSRSKDSLSDACDCLESAQNACDKIDNPSIQSSMYSSLGNAFISLKIPDKAEICFTKALNAMRSRNSSQNSLNQNEEASLLQNIGAARNLMEEYDKSLECHKEAIDIYSSLGQRAKQLHCMLNLGFAYTKLEQYDEAMDVLSKASELAETCSDKEMEFTVLENLGTVQYRNRKFDEAVQTFQKALCAVGCVSQLTKGRQATDISERIVGKLSDAINMREKQKARAAIQERLQSTHSSQETPENTQLSTVNCSTPQQSASSKQGLQTGRQGNSEEETTDNSESDESEDSKDGSPSLSIQLQSSLPKAISGGPTVGTKMKLEQRFKHLEGLSDNNQKFNPQTSTPLFQSTPKPVSSKGEQDLTARQRIRQEPVVVQEGTLATGERRRVGGRLKNMARQQGVLEPVAEDATSVNTQTTVDSKTSSVCIIL
jgi:tetratricopeptide (TPR) repeat protein